MGRAPQQEAEKKAKKAFQQFVQNIPAGKFQDIKTDPGTIYNTRAFRFDMQKMTSDKPGMHNLQIQVNFKCGIPSLAAIEARNEWEPEQIREAIFIAFEMPPTTNNVGAQPAASTLGLPPQREKAKKKK
ncbi:hypothetical protein LTR66_015885 [Elasticomyces elasticus]|nr:hypothetical protein LTR66_015885 [Elasticomyces elasticus]